jgi:hypothetical protein
LTGHFTTLWLVRRSVAVFGSLGIAKTRDAPNFSGSNLRNGYPMAAPPSAMRRTALMNTSIVAVHTSDAAAGADRRLQPVGKVFGRAGDAQSDRELSTATVDQPH